jgi:hypothetical protein
MGGSALLIYGTVSNALLEPRPIPRSLVSRLLRKSAATAPEWRQIGSSRRLMSLPASGLEKLGDEFRRSVKRRFNRPWAATSAVIDYLGLGVIEVHLRGDRIDESAPDWYVQLNFSGCAGMAQIASEVATHWAERWYHEESARIVSTLLAPHGFEPNGRTGGAAEAPVFVPVGAAGYAVYMPNPRYDPDFDSSRVQHFDVDASALEALDEETQAELLRRLDSELRPLIPEEQCCCQWCSPDFDVAVIDQLGLLK